MARGNRSIEVRVTEAVRGEWEAAAKDEGCTLSEWIRRAAEERAGTKTTRSPRTARRRVEGKGARMTFGGGDLAGPAKPDPRTK